VRRYQKGRVVEWFGFSSSSTNEGVAMRFINEGGHFGILFEADLHYSRDVKHYSAHPEEDELLILPNTSVFVVDQRFGSLFSFVLSFS